MGQKVNPVGMRIGIIRDWDANWYAPKSKVADFLHEDLKIRSFINSFYKTAMTKSNKELIIFHLRGQHIKAENSYPHDPQFSIFTVDSIKGNFSESQKRDIAFYDNATLYNDYVIANILNRYKNSNAVMLYLSDHGEEIHDFRNRYGRTDEAVMNSNILRYQFEIPFMIWCSNSYIKNNPKKIKNIKNALNKPFMNDNICQLLIDLCDIKTYYYHPSRDLISPSFKAYENRIVQGKFDYDIIMKKNNHKYDKKYGKKNQ